MEASFYLIIKYQKRKEKRMTMVKQTFSCIYSIIKDLPVDSNVIGRLIDYVDHKVITLSNAYYRTR